MSAFDVAQTFLRQYLRDAPIAELVVAFQRTLTSLGFRYFACWSHVDPLRPPPEAVVLHSYPREWIRRYSGNGLHVIDPVSSWAGRTLVPFFWDDERFCAHLTTAQQAVLTQASRYGIAHGYTVPIHAPQEGGAQPASCSVIPAHAALPAEHYAIVQVIALPLFEARSSSLRRGQGKRPPRPLSERERECLSPRRAGQERLGGRQDPRHQRAHRAQPHREREAPIAGHDPGAGHRAGAWRAARSRWGSCCTRSRAVAVESPTTLGHPHSNP